ncbi:hypothetical protein JOQ06_030066, partial [Pogonophryne albipinna]
EVGGEGGYLGQELKHAASCSAECNTETDSLSIIKLWAAQRGERGFSLQSQKRKVSTDYRFSHYKSTSLNDCEDPNTLLKLTVLKSDSLVKAHSHG